MESTNQIKRQSFPSIKHNDFVNDVLESIKQSLLDGSLRPGQRLPTESELVEQFGISRNTIREAIKMLSAIGVVEIRRGDGTYIVDKPSEKMLNPLVFVLLTNSRTTKELVELRSMIEVGYCELAAEAATDEDMQAIQEAAAKWEQYALGPRQDVTELSNLDLKFHFTIMDATHNSLIITIGRVVEELFLTSIRHALGKREVLEWGIQGHRNIVEALRSRNRERIHEAVITSLLYWSRDLEEKEL